MPVCLMDSVFIRRRFRDLIGYWRSMLGQISNCAFDVAYTRLG